MRFLAKASSLSMSTALLHIAFVHCTKKDLVIRKVRTGEGGAG